MGILNRWRQFGRRYFWPHLLLGMVAASFGVPYLPSGAQEPTPQSNTFANLSRHNVIAASFGDLSRLRETPRRTGYGVDYWHQHAIRTVIRHLTVTWVPAPGGSTFQTTLAESAEPRNAQHQVLISTLNALLTHDAVPLARPYRTAVARPAALIDHRSVIRLAQVHEIRAGPRHISLS